MTDPMSPASNPSTKSPRSPAFENLEKEIEQLQSEVAKERGNNTESEHMVSELLKEKAELKAALRDKDEQLLAQSATLVSVLKNKHYLDTLVESTRKELMMKDAMVKALNQLNDGRQDVHSTIAAMDEETESWRQEVAILKGNLAKDVQECDHLKEANHNLMRENNDLKTGLNRARIQVAQAKGDERAAQARIKALEEVNQRLTEQYNTQLCDKMMEFKGRSERESTKRSSSGFGWSPTSPPVGMTSSPAANRSPATPSQSLNATFDKAVDNVPPLSPTFVSSRAQARKPPVSATKPVTKPRGNSLSSSFDAFRRACQSGMGLSINTSMGKKECNTADEPTSADSHSPLHKVGGGMLTSPDHVPRRRFQGEAPALSALQRANPGRSGSGTGTPVRPAGQTFRSDSPTSNPKSRRNSLYNEPWDLKATDGMLKEVTNSILSSNIFAKTASSEAPRPPSRPTSRRDSISGSNGHSFASSNSQSFAGSHAGQSYAGSIGPSFDSEPGVDPRVQELEVEKEALQSNIQAMLQVIQKLVEEKEHDSRELAEVLAQGRVAAA